MSESSRSPDKPREALFLNIGKTHELCRFPETGEWSLRLKLQDDDVAHIRYLDELEVDMVEAALDFTPSSIAPTDLPGFMRKRIEQACEDAEHPKGMSTHNGMARVHAADIRRLLTLLDRAPVSATGSNERDTIIESCALAALNHPGGYSANLRIYIAESIRTLKSTPKVSAPADGGNKTNG